MDPFESGAPFDPKGSPDPDMKTIFGGVFVRPDITHEPPKIEPPGFFDRIINVALKIIQSILSFYLILFLVIFVFPFTVAALVIAVLIVRFFLKYY